MRRPTFKRRLLIGALGLVTVGALVAWKALPGNDPLSTVAVTRGDIESSVTALGTLQPRRYVDVGAQASGQIRKLHVEPGDHVEEGQLLVEIDPSTQKAKLDASHAAFQALKDRADGGEAYDQMIGEGNEEGNKVVQAAVDSLVDQTKTIERVIGSLDLGKIELEGSDSLDNPNAVFQ